MSIDMIIDIHLLSLVIKISMHDLNITLSKSNLLPLSKT